MAGVGYAKRFGESGGREDQGPSVDPTPLSRAIPSYPLTNPPEKALRVGCPRPQQTTVTFLE